MISKSFFKILFGAFLALAVVSCKNGQSLQEYYVDNKEDPNFVLVDIPTSLISPDSQMLDEEQKKVLSTVKKINMMAYKLDNETKDRYDTEVKNVKTILSSDDYEELMTVGHGDQNMRLYFKGEEEAIDEIVVFVNDNAKGFLLARVLGDDMNIGDMSSMIKSFENGDAKVDISQFEGIMDVFNQ